MSSLTETTESRPFLVSRVRRVSKSGFLYETNSKSPRLDKMIAHINLYDQTTRCMEEDLEKQRADTLAQKRMGGTRPRPQLGPRATEYESRSDEKEVPNWVTELTCRPTQESVVVTEVEEIEDVEAD
ncbi:hypothetical protein PMZ80_004376 [Knufia obscura]|uniref:Uncharacterized protein n=2 Tax=Knufia TaxID=430999 RepID=A0AAN8IHM0_9EURO|nr:hypothetical protein PMZ80_004376 [Knufia obscura]KAK5948172.1 hypothetical protein OHC33_010825 [Knufia fluminis]